MTVNDKTPGPTPTFKRRARLRMTGVTVLALGISSASLVYWLGTRFPALSDDLSMVGYDRAQTRQMGMLYGKMGLAVEQLFDDLKHPATQAKIIVAISILIAAGCFYLASLMDGGDGHAGGTRFPHG
jgi:hypothetical protein